MKRLEANSVAIDDAGLVSLSALGFDVLVGRANGPDSRHVSASNCGPMSHFANVRCNSLHDRKRLEADEQRDSPAHPKRGPTMPQRL